MRTKYRVYKYKYRSLSNNNAERDAKGLLRNEMELMTKNRVYKYK